MALEVNESNFDELLKSDKPIVLDFWAAWCGPCRTIAPHIEDLAKDYEGRAIVGKVDVDENGSIAAKYGVRNIPTVVYIKNGTVVDKHIGAATKSDFAAKLDKML